MAIFVHGWKDQSGGFHATKEQAERSDLLTKRFHAARSLVDDGHSPLIRFASTTDCAYWIAENWDELKKVMETV